MTSTLQPTVSRETLEQFQRDGFIVMRGLFSPEEVTAIRETFMEEAGNGPVEGLSEFKSGGQQYDASDPLAFYPRMMHPHNHLDKSVGQVAAGYMLDPRLYGILHDLFDEEPLAAQSMFYFKPAGARGQALHQDNFFLRVKPSTCIAAWLAVDDADAENGGMMVVPGSNDMEIVCPESADSAASFTRDFVAVPAGLHEVPVTMQAGDVLFFNGSVIHGSYPNSSKDRFRRSLITHYVPRSSEEVSGSYSRMTFDGGTVAIAAATGGGPCGTPQMSMSPH
ncbi:MAG: phytanoyl-CoA dioxygenase family protein [Janthinobacterium lividum]